MNGTTQEHQGTFSVDWSKAPTIDDVVQIIGSAAFEYITLCEAQVRYPIAAGDGWVFVVGHGDWASYEWCYLSPREFQHSNSGYGGSASALRDGLIAVEGLSCAKCGGWHPAEAFRVECQRCQSAAEE